MLLRDVSSGARRTDADIRQALAEVLAPTETDQLMGWSPGTARKSRGRPHGLPEPDARIGATPVWFRATFERWRAARPGRGAGGGRPARST